MNRAGDRIQSADSRQPSLQVYLLGEVGFDAILALQKRLVYQFSGEREAGALILCEHGPLITVGREGSWSHLAKEVRSSDRARLPVRFVNRGGGCFLHMPGQLAFYAILPLDRLGLGLQAYLQTLQEAWLAVLDDFNIRGTAGQDCSAVLVGNRPIAGFGIAVRDWVSYFGGTFNAHCDLRPYSILKGGWTQGRSVTSLERERHGPVHPSLVRERFLEHFTRLIGFANTAIFFDHPLLQRKAPAHALSAAAGS